MELLLEKLVGFPSAANRPPSCWKKEAHRALEKAMLSNNATTDDHPTAVDFRP